MRFPLALCPLFCSKGVNWSPPNVVDFELLMNKNSELVSTPSGRLNRVYGTYRFYRFYRLIPLYFMKEDRESISAP